MCTQRRMDIDRSAHREKYLAREVIYINYCIFSSLSDFQMEMDSGAESRTRTDDLLITNQLLYQLSYFGLLLRLYRRARLR